MRLRARCGLWAQGGDERDGRRRVWRGPGGSSRSRAAGGCGRAGRPALPPAAGPAPALGRPCDGFRGPGTCGLWQLPPQGAAACAGNGQAAPATAGVRQQTAGTHARGRQTRQPQPTEHRLCQRKPAQSCATAPHGTRRRQDPTACARRSPPRQRARPSPGDEAARRRPSRAARIPHARARRGTLGAPCRRRAVLRAPAPGALRGARTQRLLGTERDRRTSSRAIPTPLPPQHKTRPKLHR